MTEPNWGDLERRNPAEHGLRTDDFDRLAAQTFASGPGSQLLEMLREQHFETPFNALAGEPALRVRLANQAMIIGLERARDRGIDALNKKKS